MLAIYAPGPFRRVANLNGIWIECIILYELPSEAKNKWLTEEKNIFFDIKNTYLPTYYCPQNKTGAFVESMILAEIPILWNTFNLSIVLLLSYCILNVLWGQPIKLVQVVSTSELHEN